MPNPPPESTPRYRVDLGALEARINALLPPRYQSCYDGVSPASMGSADLKFACDGRVAWDEMWTSFCELALAGGPSHRGTLLEPVMAEEALAEPQKYGDVVEEIGRGIRLATGLPVVRGDRPGWVGVRCDDEAMAVWLLRAILVENVSARREGDVLYVPAGPRFRLEKEIKNVVTSLAKTHHYYAYHLFATPGGTATMLVAPPSPEAVRARPDAYRAVVDEIERGVTRATGLPTVASRSPGWVAVCCADESMAVWMLRAVLVENVLARREGAILCLPAGPEFARDGEVCRVVAVLAWAWHSWNAHVAGGQG